MGKILSWRLAALIAAMAMVILPTPSFADDLTLTRQVLLEPGQYQKSNAIERTNDGGFVIAGALEPHEGWAIRTDADGNVKWRYTIPLVDPPNGLDTSPIYNDAAVMPDDSVFLCGSMPRTRGVHAPALLTHLDRDGKRIDEQVLHPEIDKSYVGGSFSKCTLWDRGVLIIGVTSNPDHAKPTPQHPIPEIHRAYWLLALDQNGKKKWETLIPMTELGGWDEVSILPRPDGSFVFAAGRNTLETELIHVRHNGDVENRKTLPNGAYLIVQPIDKDDSKLEVVSVLTKKWLAAITFNDDLEETSHLIEPGEYGTATTAYRLPNQSLVLFGSRVYSQDSDVPKVLKVDAALKNVQTLYFQPKNAYGWVADAVPTVTPGEFASIRDVLTPSGTWAAQTHDEQVTHHLGVGLAFIDVNQHQ